jgi:hypothetical protein
MSRAALAFDSLDEIFEGRGTLQPRIHCQHASVMGGLDDGRRGAFSGVKQSALSGAGGG